jgi:hypothetical protein
MSADQRKNRVVPDCVKNDEQSSPLPKTKVIIRDYIIINIVIMRLHTTTIHNNNQEKSVCNTNVHRRARQEQAAAQRREKK